MEKAFLYATEYEWTCPECEKVNDSESLVAKAKCQYCDEWIKLEEN